MCCMNEEAQAYLKLLRVSAEKANLNVIILTHCIRLKDRFFEVNLKTIITVHRVYKPQSIKLENHKKSQKQVSFKMLFKMCTDLVII